MCVCVCNKYSWSQNFTFQNLQNVNYSTKIRGIIQNACYFLFTTDMNKIFHIKMFKFSPEEKILVEFIKMTPFKSSHTLDY